MKYQYIFFIILDPPATAAEISANPSGFAYNIGSNVTLTCQQRKGNPISTLSWNCKGIDMTGTNLSTSSRAVSVLNLTMSKSFNKQGCNCIANHILFSESKITEALLTVYGK